jgi:hypothetical protein
MTFRVGRGCGVKEIIRGSNITKDNDPDAPDAYCTTDNRDQCTLTMGIVLAVYSPRDTIDPDCLLAGNIRRTTVSVV